MDPIIYNLLLKNSLWYQFVVIWYKLHAYIHKQRQPKSTINNTDYKHAVNSYKPNSQFLTNSNQPS